MQSNFVSWDGVGGASVNDLCVLTSVTKILCSSVTELVVSGVVVFSVVENVLVELVVDVVEVVLGATEVIEVLGSVDSGVTQLEVFMSSFRPPLDGVAKELKLLLVIEKELGSSVIVFNESSMDGVEIEGLTGFKISKVGTVVSGRVFIFSDVVEGVVLVLFSVDIVVKIVSEVELGETVVSGICVLENIVVGCSGWVVVSNVSALNRVSSKLRNILSVKPQFNSSSPPWKFL